MSKPYQKMSVFELLWAMYSELLRDRDSSSPRDNSGMIIGRYAQMIEQRLASPQEGK